MQTTYGSNNPPNYVKLTWGVAQSIVALILLYSGGLDALQNALIIAALPFSVIIALMMASLYKSLNREKKELGLYIKPKPRKPKEPKPHKEGVRNMNMPMSLKLNRNLQKGHSVKGCPFSGHLPQFSYLAAGRTLE